MFLSIIVSYQVHLITPGSLKVHLLKLLFLVVMPLLDIVLQHLLRLEAPLEDVSHFNHRGFLQFDSEDGDREVTCALGREIHDSTFDISRFNKIFVF